MHTVPSSIEAIVDALSRARDHHRLLLFDFDGTLVEFADNPDDVRLGPSRLRLLEAIAARTDVTLGIVSGRQIQTLRQRAPIGGATFFAGLHGLEIEGPDVRFLHPGVEAGRAVIDVLRQAMQDQIAAMPGVRIEDKVFGFTVHWRRADPAVRDTVRSAVETTIGPLEEAHEVYVQPGFDHVDVIPHVRWNKGSAVHWIADLVQRRTRRPVWPMFVGDDLTDEHAFEAIGDHGVTVVVGVRASTAHLRLANPAAVEQLLDALVLMR